MRPTAEDFDALYANGETPWTLTEPPVDLLALVDRGIAYRSALEVGCGAGYNTIALAQRGIAALGIDYSQRAVALARENARAARAPVRFALLDWRDLARLREAFTFVFDWRFLHELHHQSERHDYVHAVGAALAPSGHYLSVSFSASATQWGEGKVRTNPVANKTMHFASADELRGLFSPFTILEHREIDLLSKGSGLVRSNYTLMQKR